MRDIRLQIICPASPQFRVTAGRAAPRRTRIFRFSMLSALSVAAAAPPGVHAEIVDENVEPIDFDTAADVIGISFMTYNAPRAYEIADRFRSLGKTVIFGGYHPSLLPHEAAAHADAVCIGEAEANLPRMLEDYAQGRLQKFYRLRDPEFHSRPADPGLLRRGGYMRATVVQATRGCAHACEFCSVSAFSERLYKRKAIADVIAEIEAGHTKRVLFMDDNLAADPEYFRALLRALTPLRVRWYSQIGFAITRDAELLDLMRASGCGGVFIGFESLMQDSLIETGKGFNRAADYESGIAALHRHGIAVLAAFVVGYDHDGPEVFERTLAFLDRAGADALQLAILTPFPGTPLFQRLKRDGRIFDPDWRHYDLGHVTFEPRNMSPAELQAGHDRLVREFYSLPRMLRRIWRQLRYLRFGELGLLTLINWGYRLKLRRDGYASGVSEATLLRAEVRSPGQGWR